MKKNVLKLREAVTKICQSVSYRMRANRLINEGNMTGGVRKIWTGREEGRREEVTEEEET